MSILIDLPPAMAQEAQEYVTVRGTTLERLFLDYLKAELKRRRELDSAMSEFDALVEKTSSRRKKHFPKGNSILDVRTWLCF